jgi:hypothetical protein
VFKGTVAGVLSFFMSAKGLRIAVQVESNEGQLLADFVEKLLAVSDT